MPLWIPAVAASPWCALMARWFPFRAGRIGLTLLVHFGGALVFVALHMALLIVIHNVWNGAHGVVWEGMAHRYAFYVALSHLVWNLVSQHGRGWPAGLAEAAALAVPGWLLLRAPRRRTDSADPAALGSER